MEPCHTPWASLSTVFRVIIFISPLSSPYVIVIRTAMMKSSKLSSSPYCLRPAVCHSQLKLANGPHLLSCQSQAITFCNCKLLCFIHLFVCHMCPFVIVYVCFQRHPLVSKMSINADHFEKRQFLYLFDFVLVWWNLALVPLFAFEVVL